MSVNYKEFDHLCQTGNITFSYKNSIELKKTV